MADQPDTAVINDSLQQPFEDRSGKVDREFAIPQAPAAAFGNRWDRLGVKLGDAPQHAAVIPEANDDLADAQEERLAPKPLQLPLEGHFVPLGADFLGRFQFDIIGWAVWGCFLIPYC